MSPFRMIPKVVKEYGGAGFFLAGSLLLASGSMGCNGKSSTDSNASSGDSYVGKLGARLVDKLVLGSGDSSGAQSTPSTIGVQGLYFSQLEIVAYNYRPGQELQNHWPGMYSSVETNIKSDWSHWAVLQGGGVGTNDVVLQPGTQLDFSSIQGANYPIDASFAKQVGKFSVDFLEVWVKLPGVLYDNTFYGQNNYSGTKAYSMDGGAPEGASALYQYPALSSFPFYFSPPQYSLFPVGKSNTGLIFGGTLSEMSVLFARNDWFPEPVLVQAGSSANCTICDGRPVTWSSSPLNDKQLTILNSLISEGTQRRTYEHIIVIPNDLAVVGLNTSTVGAAISKESTTGAGSTDPGQAAADPTSVVVSPSLDAVVEFDVANSIDLNTSTFAQADFWNGSKIKFATDSRGVPMGLSVKFVNHGTKP